MIPDTMTAWRIDGFGAPDVLQRRREPVPSVDGDEVLVEVAYCGVCRHDLLTRSGAFPNVPLPLTLGHQVSGTVVAAGPTATWAPGTRVMSTIFMGCGHCSACRSGDQAVCLTVRAQFMGDDFDGGYAEYLGAPSRAFIRVPDTLSLEVAAVVNCTLGTAYHAAHTRGRLAAGQDVVITGASGGIGLHAISVVKQAGARVIAITSRPGQTGMLLEHGADEVVADPELKFAHAVKGLTGGIGADLVLEVAGDPTLAQSLHAVRTGGRVVVIGNVSGKPSEVRIAHLVMKEISLLGTKSCSNAELGEVMELVAAGELSVDINRTIPLDSVRDAHRDMEEQRTSGRIVLAVGGDPVAPSGEAAA
ncbi:zinc-binding dehydrogenase [Pseudolysinimonas kribbensis]|uniref:alcohol dehydrogenase n=2 Tax=Pseudolysinimonas kribbensis TaxID=433641 RepID=A0ABQ6K508_9MICO|nr:alcohol dehydrogenase [Pseudolysinimonas kribbensis]